MKNELTHPPLHPSNKPLKSITYTILGRSMIEMLGVLAIIGVLSIGGLFGYRMAMTYHQANETIHDVMLRGTNVPMIDDGYLQRPVGYAFSFPGLAENGNEGTFYAMRTSRTGRSGYIYAVEISQVPSRVCERILRMKPGAIDLITIKVGGVEQEFTGENLMLCAGDTAPNMLFYFDDTFTSEDPNNPDNPDPDNPDPDNPDPDECNQTCGACETLNTTTCTCEPSDDPCCNITPPGDCGCAEILYNVDGCPYGCGPSQTIEIFSGSCCDENARSCCPLTETCNACVPSDPCCGLSGSALACCKGGTLTCSECQTPNYDTCSCEKSKDPCCGSDDPCCGNPDPCACNPDSPCCDNPNSCACSPNAKCCVAPESCTCEERGGSMIISGYGDTNCCSEPTYCCNLDAGCTAASACTPSKCCNNTCDLCSPCDEATGACVPIECGQCQQCNSATGGCELVPDCPMCSPSANSYTGDCPTDVLGNDAVITPVSTVNGTGLACCRTCTDSSSSYHSATAFINQAGNKECCYGQAFEFEVYTGRCDSFDCGQECGCIDGDCEKGPYPDTKVTRMGCCPPGTKAHIATGTVYAAVCPAESYSSQQVLCCPNGIKRECYYQEWEPFSLVSCSESCA